jgi:hypothetical protein
MIRLSSTEKQSSASRVHRPTEGSIPDPDECREPADVGKIYHDAAQDIWYECVFDRRKQVYTWTILPPGDGT